MNRHLPTIEGAWPALRTALITAIATLMVTVAGPSTGFAADPAAATASGATPTVALPSEAEQTATPQQFRDFRSYGAKPNPGGVRTKPQPPANTSARRDNRPGAPTTEGLDPRVIACAARYRSFKAATGTYLTADGQVRTCPYLL